MNPVGEPDAGKPHVRFDERRPETEPWTRLRHPHLAKAAGNSYFLSLQPPRRSSTLPKPIDKSRFLLHKSFVRSVLSRQ